jgi:predicted NBD/HSP70 family sugar kinase
VTTALARRAGAVRADQTSVRRANLGVVLRHVAEHAPCSRASVAARTGLTRGTVSSLVAELIDLELLREGGITEPPRVGRPSVSLGLGDAVVGVGLEVNVDYLAVCVEDLRGVVRYERRVVRDNRSSSVAPVLTRLAKLANDALEAAENDGLHVAGIAVAVPGLVDVERSTLLRAPNLGWSEVPVAELLGAKLNTAHTLLVENESNAAALAEHWRGAGQGLRSFICVFGEIGVGGGIYVDGELFRGGRGYGGEIGHTLIDPGGRSCACGNRGCLETVVGLEAIALDAGIVLDSRDRPASVTEQLVDRATAGDLRTLAALARAAEALGLALASTINLLDLDGVVLAGCFGPLAPWLVDNVDATLRTNVLSADWSSCDVRASTLGERAAVHGSAAIVLRSILTDPWSARRRRETVKAAAS